MFLPNSSFEINEPKLNDPFVIEALRGVCCNDTENFTPSNKILIALYSFIKHAFAILWFMSTEKTYELMVFCYFIISKCQPTKCFTHLDRTVVNLFP